MMRAGRPRILQLSVGSVSGGDSKSCLCEFCVLCFVICELVFSYLCMHLQADHNIKILLVDGLSGKRNHNEKLLLTNMLKEWVQPLLPVI